MKNKSRVSWFMLIPTLIIMIGFVFYPIIVTFTYSLQRFKLTEPENTEFIGLDNYISILKGSDFSYSLMNTVVILVLVVSLSLVLSLAVALMLNKDTKINGVLTAIAILPWALPPIVNGIIWRWIFYPGFGLANKFLYKLGLIDQPIQWTANRKTLLVIVAIVVAWRVIPFCSIIFLSALQSIPKEVYESASIDGAGHVESFFRITLPLLLPSFAIVLTNTSIGAINVFDEIIALSGFSHLGQTLLVYNYNTTFTFLNFGLGSALTYIIMLASGILGIFYIKSMYRDKEVV